MKQCCRDSWPLSPLPFRSHCKGLSPASLSLVIERCLSGSVITNKPRVALSTGQTDLIYLLPAQCEFYRWFIVSIPAWNLGKKALNHILNGRSEERMRNKGRVIPCGPWKHDISARNVSKSGFECLQCGLYMKNVTYYYRVILIHRVYLTTMDLQLFICLVTYLCIEGLQPRQPHVATSGLFTRKSSIRY